MDTTILPHNGKKEKIVKLKLSTEDFVKKATAVHGDKYDYSISEYKGRNVHISIICKKHGVFNQSVSNHLSGNGCPLCGFALRGKKKVDTSIFIERARRAHGNRYDYSNAEYSGRNRQTVIICPEHGEFLQIAGHHMNGSGCPSCGGRKKLTQEDFINLAIKTHGNRYDYSLVDYVRAKSKVDIVCTQHGVFSQSPQRHMVGQGCPKCKISTIRDAILLTTDEFVEKASRLHEGKYDYSLVKYVDTKTPVKIICARHGVFEQRAHSHLTGHGCQKCCMRRGEMMISNILKSLGMFYYTQVAFAECVDKSTLWFDFYLPSKRMLIEFDGDQHFEPKEYWGGEAAFEGTRRRDTIKNEFAKSNHYNLIRLTYKDLDDGTLEESLLKLLYCVPAI